MASREEPQLFDFPLDPEPPRRRRSGRTRAEAPEETAEEIAQAELPFEPETEEEPDDDELEPEEDELPPAGERIAAAVTDLAVHLAVLVLAVAGIVLAGIPPRWSQGFALALFLLPFSFLYTVIPLAFWGQTPGMAWREIRSSNPDGESLTAAQAALRWLGGLVTLALGGLPALLLLSDRSLSDRLSGSETTWTEISAEEG